MKKWKCHKVVEAGKIIVMKPSSDDRVVLQTENDGFIEVDRQYMDKHKPKVGGYYVLYEDGYHSFSPAEAFENGYTEVSDETKK